METLGWWVSIVIDDEFANGRHDVGTVFEIQKGVLEQKPFSRKYERYFRRYFVPDSRQDNPPDIQTKLHKLPADLSGQIGREEVAERRQETIKGKAELDRVRRNLGTINDVPNGRGE